MLVVVLAADLADGESLLIEGTFVLSLTLTVLALTDRSAFKKVMNLPDDVEPFA